MTAHGSRVLQVKCEADPTASVAANLRPADPRWLQAKCEADPTASVASNLRPADPRLTSGLLHVKRENALQVKRESNDASCAKPAPVAPAPAIVSIDISDDEGESAPSSKSVPPPPPSADGQLSSMIMNSLKRLQPSTAPAAVAPQNEVSQMLMNSLRALGADALRSSAAGNSLLSAVQHMHAAPLSAAALQQLPKPVMVKQELLQTKQELTAVKQESHSVVKQENAPEYPTEIMSEAELAAFPGVGVDSVAAPLPAAKVRRTTAPPERPPRDLDQEDSDGEGVPHRLPPGFGAVPEDLIEARQRQKEEERMRRIKSTQPCRFGLACKKRDCPNMHPEGRNIDEILNPCAFGRRCKRINCFYDHPEGRDIDDDPTRGVCRLGKRCKRPDCLYAHPEGRDVPAGVVQLCFFCHETGHIAQECPRNPASWAFNRIAASDRQLMAAIPGMEALSM